MPPDLLIAILAFATPYVQAAIKAWQDRNHTTVLPTTEQLLADFKAHGAAILAEGEAWNASHPQS